MSSSKQTNKDNAMQQIEKLMQQIPVKDLDKYDIVFEKIENKLSKTEHLIHYFILVLECIKRKGEYHQEFAVLVENFTRIYEIDSLYNRFIESKNPFYKQKAMELLEPNYGFMKRTIYHFKDIFSESNSYSEMFTEGKL